MPELNDDQRRIIAVLLLVAAGVICLTSIASSHDNNQIVRTIPGAPPAPVVPELPRLMARLSQQKNRCEDRTSAAIDSIRRNSIGGATYERGRLLYDLAKESQNGMITYLQAGLVRRFNGDDPQQIAQMAVDSQQKVDATVDWANSLIERSIGDGIPESIMAMVEAWLQDVNSRNDHAIELLREDLEKFRIRPWSELQ